MFETRLASVVSDVTVRAWLLLGVFAVALPVSAQPREQSREPVPPAAPIARPLAIASETTFVRITIDASRSPIAMDTEAGLSAEIKNVSSVPVRIYENETIFITMPETRIYGQVRQSIQGCATFPTQGNTPDGRGVAETSSSQAAQKVDRMSVRPPRGYDVLLQPGDAYRVFWDLTANGCTGEPQLKGRFWNNPLLWLEEKWQRIAFTPGVYKVYLDVVLYPEDRAAYHTATEGRDVEISASQQMVLLGAFLGGLLAYLIKLYYGVETHLTVRMRDTPLKRLIGSTEWISAGIFGAAMVILASRLSDTFPVRVSASDFWGSMTLGFVFQWLGVKLLEKLPGIDTTK
jgi:hypothetical protein